jgi:hypothetical protein
MFLCGLCRAQVVLCSGCDRGQIYCARGCAVQARGRAQRATGRRYQASRPGRFAHAARARRYRARCKIVTHQGSAEPAGGDLLGCETAVVAPEVVIQVGPSAQHCACCGVRCAGAVRLGFLRHPRRLARNRPIGAHRTEGVDDHLG